MPGGRDKAPSILLSSSYMSGTVLCIRHALFHSWCNQILSNWLNNRAGLKILAQGFNTYNNVGTEIRDFHHSLFFKVPFAKIYYIPGIVLSILQ